MKLRKSQFSESKKLERSRQRRQALESIGFFTIETQLQGSSKKKKMFCWCHSDDKKRTMHFPCDDLFNWNLQVESTRSLLSTFSFIFYSWWREIKCVRFCVETFGAKITEEIWLFSNINLGIDFKTMQFYWIHTRPKQNEYFKKKIQK